MSVRSQRPKLVFLISQPRSGSTLLQRILGGHPSIHTTAEPWIMLHPVYALRKDGYTSEYNATLANSALTDFLAAFPEGEKTYFDSIRLMAENLYGAACYQAGKTHFLDKTPRYYFIISELAQIFPEARFIFLYRNPLAVLSSLLNTYVKGHWPVLASYRSDLLDAPQLMINGVQEIGNRALVVHYETLVTNNAEQVKKICEHLELEFIPEILEYGQFNIPAGKMGDPAVINQYGHAITDSLDRWHDLATHRQTQHFALRYLKYLGPETMAKLGYDYAEIKMKIENLSPTKGKIEYTWESLLYPDPAFKKRLYLLELALLEHRRLVHSLRKLKNKIFPGRNN